MPNKKRDEHGDYDIIPASEAFAEFCKNPKFVQEYEALEEEFAEIRRQIRAKDARRQARRAWRATLVARVRDFWYSLAGRLDRVA